MTTVYHQHFAGNLWIQPLLGLLTSAFFVCVVPVHGDFPASHVRATQEAAAAGAPHVYM